MAEASVAIVTHFENKSIVTDGAMLRGYDQSG
jgi:hypothetical protein